MAGTPGGSATDIYPVALPPTSGNASLNGQWNSWLSNLAAWRAAESAANGGAADLNPATTTTPYTYSNGGGTHDGSATYDITFAFNQTGTPGTPALLQLDENNFAVNFNADTQLVFDIAGADSSFGLAQLAALTTVKAVDVNGLGPLDTVIFFGNGHTLTLIDAGASSLSDISNQIVVKPV